VEKKEMGGEVWLDQTEAIVLPETPSGWQLDSLCHLTLETRIRVHREASLTQIQWSTYLVDLQSSLEVKAMMYLLTQGTAEEIKLHQLTTPNYFLVA